MIIGIDATNLREGGGLTHLCEVLRVAMPRRNEIDKVFAWGGRKTLSILEDRPWLEKVCPSEIDQGWLSRVYWQKYTLPKLLNEAGCDLLFVPGGSHSGNFRPVVTISQNLLPFELQEMFRYGLSRMTLRLLLLRWLQSRSFRHADGMIFLTNYAKQCVLQILGKFQSKVVIIPHGLSDRFRMKPKVQKSISEYSVANPLRLIYVSSIDQYKHQWHVVDAVSQLRQEGLPLVLNLVGPSYPPALSRLKETIGRLPFTSDFVCYHGAVPYKDLHLQYAQSDIGIFASSCENLPNTLIETMATGLPIACSNRGPMPEVLQDAGVYFDPEEPKDIARALGTLIVSAKLREEKATAGYQLAQNFTWEQCANQTFAFLSETANKHKYKK